MVKLKVWFFDSDQKRAVSVADLRAKLESFSDLLCPDDFSRAFFQDLVEPDAAQKMKVEHAKHSLGPVFRSHLTIPCTDRLSVKLSYAIDVDSYHSVDSFVSDKSKNRLETEMPSERADIIGVLESGFHVALASGIGVENIARWARSPN